ncbi:PEP-CTERM sorting domain-containing protein [Klebsiella quasipneumoniae]|nr:PEP-CTERM sorting domain-containing protein [Klebsiella pneumoniae]
MIKDYLIVAYLTAIAARPATLALLGLSAGVAFYMRRRVLG